MKYKAIFFLAQAVPATALAFVNPQNGNFHIGYDELVMEMEGHKLELGRGYNSKSTDIGWFGFGWGSGYETRLTVLPDGSAFVVENGNGQVHFYGRKGEKEVREGVKRITEAAVRQDGLSLDASARLADKLLGDEEFRRQQAVRYGTHGNLAVGATLAGECGKDALIRLEEGYRRNDCQHSTRDMFDLQGRLIRREFRDGYAVFLDYRERNVAAIRDTLGQKLELKWTSSGFVSEVTGGGHKVTFIQDQRGDLVRSEQPEGNRYLYSYDGNHNLTKIAYLDNSSMLIRYAAEVSGRVESVTERSGARQIFLYGQDRENGNKYWTSITVTTPDGDRVSRKFEFENRISTTGVGQVVSIVQTDGNHVSKKKFDDQGRIISSTDGQGGFIEYAYDPLLGKIIREVRGNRRTDFEYDGKANLIRARNSEGLLVDLEYDGKGLISRLVEVNPAEETRRELKFQYDGHAHPTRITLAGVGSIDVEYGENGEISRVDSAQGAGIALQVSFIFQSLLSLVRVAGIQF